MRRSEAEAGGEQQGGYTQEQIELMAMSDAEWKSLPEEELKSLQEKAEKISGVFSTMASMFYASILNTARGQNLQIYERDFHSVISPHDQDLLKQIAEARNIKLVMVKE